MQFQGSASIASDNRQDLRLQAGLWLKAAREQAGLSQRDLAERVGVLYYTFISQIEGGKGRIPAERYEAWAQALGMAPRDFAMRMLSFYEPTTYDLIFREG
ncbi:MULTISPECIES: helix-turn-helix transcriptional regulator [unclassified Pannonibacter]|uniref:helix-turn-helix domain-containing protein n=1 Tax=unclassified Pannonibacter TaxID=2627228 RepID=UPI001647DAD6|nr:MULTISPECIES: helix-turn-helix transcriptional regulator [unclassified Pannonibacter]